MNKRIKKKKLKEVALRNQEIYNWRRHWVESGLRHGSSFSDEKVKNLTNLHMESMREGLSSNNLCDLLYGCATGVPIR